MTPNYRKYLRYGEYAVVTALLALSAYVAANLAFGVQTIYVVSDSPSSMSPTMNYGDMALTYRSSFASLKVGDIVLFNDPRGNPGVIVHRIVSEQTCGGELCFQTKGDNGATNPTTDPWNLTAPFYLSQVVLVVPALGYISPALWGFEGFYVLIPISFVALVGFFVAYGRRVGQAEAASKKEEDTHG